MKTPMKNPRHGLQAMSVFSGPNLLSWGSHVFPLQSELLTPRCLPHREDLSLHYASPPPNSFWVIHHIAEIPGGTADHQSSFSWAPFLFFLGCLGHLSLCMRASQVALVVKNLSANAGDIRHSGSIPGWGRFPWRRAWQPTPVFLSGECHGQRSLAGYSPWSHKEPDTTEET